MRKLFKRNKSLNTYIVHLTNGKKLKVRAKNYEITYFTSTGKCSTLKFPGQEKGGFIFPASVMAVIEK